MAYQNFIPTVWASAINRDLEKALVFAEDCNRQYEGDVKKQGDTVRILGVGKPTVTTTTDKKIVLPDAEDVDDNSVTMAINHISYFNYKVDDIDKRQAKGGIMEALQSEATYECADEMDQLIASLAKEREAIKYASSAVQITAANVLPEIDKALQKLYENNVRQNSKIIVDLCPWVYTLFRQAYTAKDTNNSKALANGQVAEYGNAIIKMSNNVAKNSAGDSLIMVRTDKAIAFANPMTHVEPYRPEKGFSDAVKGFVLYDAKIVRPKELIVMNVKA